MLAQKASAGNSKLHNDDKHMNDLGMWQVLISPYNFAEKPENAHVGSIAPHILMQAPASGRHR